MQHYSILTAYAADRTWNHQSHLATRYILAQEAAHITQTTQDSIIDRMDEIERNGTYDLDADDLRRLRQWQVGDEMITCQVAVLGGDTPINFWSIADGHQRRILVDRRTGRTWIANKRGQADDQIRRSHRVYPRSA